MILLSPAFAIGFKRTVLVCPTCKGQLNDKGYGLASCDKCDSIMLHKSGLRREELFGQS